MRKESEDKKIAVRFYELEWGYIIGALEEKRESTPMRKSEEIADRLIREIKWRAQPLPKSLRRKRREKQNE